MEYKTTCCDTISCQTLLSYICEIEKTKNKNPEQISEWSEKITGIKSQYIQYVGFDCANKSLGYTVAFYNKSIREQLAAVKEELLGGLRSDHETAFIAYKKAFVANESARTFVQKSKTQLVVDDALDELIKHITQAALLASDINGGNGIINAIAKYLLASYFLTITYFIPIKYGVIDLIPGKQVKETKIMERTRSLKHHLSKINPDPNAIILVEDQPTVLNEKSTTVQDQICYAYSEWDVKCVPPRWKNRLCFGPGLTYEEIRAKYKKKYSANKAHSKLNFLKYINVIGEEKMLTGISKENYDDLADSCMQILAYEQFKDSTESAT